MAELTARGQAIAAALKSGAKSLEEAGRNVDAAGGPQRNSTSSSGPFTSALQNQGTTVSSGLSNLLITQPANQDAVSKADEIVNQGQNKSSTLSAQLKQLQNERAAKTQVWENGIYMGENKELAQQYDAQIADVQQQLKAEQEKQAEAAKPKTSSARDEYIRQLNDLIAYEGYATTVEQADAINKQKNELRQKLHEEDQRLGNAAQFYDSGERNAAIIKGGLGQVGSAYTNLLGTIKGVGNRLIESSNEFDQRVAANPYSGWATDPLTTANIAAGTTDEQLKQGMAQMQADEQRLYQSADTQLANANAQLAQAKEGLSGLGQFGVDAATTLIQLGVDAAGSATGLGMLPMFARAAGGSMQEARQAGADTKQQVLYGLTKAAIEVGTEKLFDGVAGVFGRGAADDVVESVVKRLANSDTGRTLIRAFAAASGEGTEEAISDLLDPFAKLIYNDQALREAWENRSDLAGDMLYDYLLGFSMGGLGSVTSVATGQDAAKNAELRAIESPAKNTTAQAAPSAAQTAQEAAGDIQTPAIPQNASTAPTAELNQTQQKIPGQELLDYVNSQQGQQTAQSNNTQTTEGKDLLLNYGKDKKDKATSEQSTIPEEVKQYIAADKVVVKHKGKEYTAGDIGEYAEWLTRKYGADTINDLVDYLVSAEGWSKAKVAKLVDAAQTLGYIQVEKKNGTVISTPEYAAYLADEYYKPWLDEASQQQNNTAPQGAENTMLNDADLQEYLSVGERQHVRNAKDAQLRNGESPILTTIGQIRKFIRSAMYGEQRDTIKAYGKVGGKLAQDILNASDGKTDVSGYYLELDGNRLRHMKDHIDTDTDGRNIPLSAEQAELLTEYINEYDSVLRVLKRKDGSTRVYLSKKTSDGHVVIVELVSKGRQSLQPVTAWQNTNEAFESIWGKERADSASQAGQKSGSNGYQSALTETTSPVSTGSASAGAPAPTTSIPNTPQNVNTETGPNMRERGFSQNIRTDENMEAELRRQFEDSPLMYQQLSNADTLAKAQEIYGKGLEEATAELNKWIGEGKAGRKMPPESIPLSRMIANELTRQGKVEEATRIESDIATELTYVGEYAQAARMLRDTGSPAAKAKFIKGLANRLSDDLSDRQRAKNVKRGLGDEEGNIKVDSALIAEYANAQTDEASNAAIDKINQNIANQMPATLMEKINALRYMNMLGNLKTQGRNIGGNAAMLAAAMAKRRTQAAIEAFASAVTDGKTERTTSFGINRNLYKAGIKDANAIMKTLQGDAKYSDASRVAIKEIQDRRQIFDSKFPGKFLEGYRKITNWAMEAGDRVFLRLTYADAFQGYLSAHGIKDISEASPEMLNSARVFAIKEAQEATFRDSNKIADRVSSIGRGKNATIGEKILSEGTAPFRKTPANVGIRAVEYGPLGIVNTAVIIARAKKGNATTTDVINSISKTVTGSTLAAAGWLLAASGDAQGSEDDRELAYFQNMQGEMEYSIKVGDEYISLSQFAPMAIPFFMGVELYSALEDSGLTADALLKIPGAITDPMLEMSMLSGVNDALSGLSSYGGDSTALPNLFVNSAISLLTQGLTNSLAGQAEQASEEYRQTTYSQPGNKLGFFQYALGKAAAKTPVVEYNQQDYIDAWGRRQSNGPLYERLFNAFLNPVYTSTDRSTEVDAELERLYTENKDLEGFPNVLPQKASRSLEYTKGVVMTPEEYQQYSIDRGQMSLELVSDFMQSAQYKDMDDQRRAEVISNLYSLAADRALKKVKTSNGVEYTGNYDDIAKLTDIPAYMAYQKVMSDASNKDNERASADWDTLNQLMQDFSSLPEDVKDTLKSNTSLHAKALEYAANQGINAYDWYTTYDTIAKTEAALGSEAQVASALAINFMDDGTDEQKLAMLQSQLPLKKDGSIPTIVRRYDVALAEGISYDAWTRLEIELKDKDTTKTWAIRTAAQNAGVNPDVAQAIYKKLYKDPSYTAQLNEEFLTLNPRQEESDPTKTFEEMYNELNSSNNESNHQYGQTTTANNPLMTYSQPSLLFKTFDDYAAYKPPKAYPLMKYAK